MSSLINNLMFLILILYYVLVVFPIQYRSQHIIDQNGNLIFYPRNFKQGYVATEEDIEKSVKALRKIYFFNIIGFNNDIKEIFANSEVVDLPLPKNVLFQNQVKLFSWLNLTAMLFIILMGIVFCWEYKFYVVMSALCLLLNLRYIFAKIKQK